VKPHLRFLHGLYGLLLRLYPKQYRDEYGEELQIVFDSSMEDSGKMGNSELAITVLKEFASLPGAILYQHLRERRKANMIGKFDSYFDFSHGSWKELLTALLPFFVAGAGIPVIEYLIRLKVIPVSGLLGSGILLALFGLFIIFLIVGMLKDMPRWSLPYFGFVLSLFSVFLFSFLFGTPIYFLFGNYRDASLLMDILWDGISWYGLLPAIALLAAKSRTSPALQRFRNDWTLLCFLLYSAAPFSLLLTFDEYVGEEPYTLLTFLVLAGGAWLYLRSKSEWKRFGLLFGALTLAMLIATAAKLILIPSQDWANPLDTSLINSDAKHTAIMGMWFAIGMLIPPGIKLWPRSGHLIQVSPSEG
jgi:hypothetical protein